MSRLPTLVLLGSVAVASTAMAETSPYYLGGSVGYTHVSNLYRLPASQVPNSDDVTSVSLLAGLDQPIGRQRIFGDASVSHNSYRRDSSLNNVSYSARAGLDWQALDKLSGTASVRSGRNLATYSASNDVAVIREKNIEQNDQAQVRARYGMAGKLYLEGGLSYQRRDYSAPAYKVLEYSENTASAGVGYRPSADLSFGLTGRYTDGSGFANLGLGVINNDYKRKDVDLSSDWTASAASLINARLSYSRIDNAGSFVTDYSGVTGRISWQWQPTGKLRFSTSLARDTTQENYLNLGNTGGASANRVGTSAQLGANYALSAKVLFDANVNVYDLNRGGATDAKDRSVGLNLSARWLPTRNAQLSCQISRDKRDSDVTTFSYTANSYGCTAQLTLR